VVTGDWGGGGGASGALASDDWGGSGVSEFVLGGGVEDGGCK